MVGVAEGCEVESGAGEEDVEEARPVLHPLVPVLAPVRVPPPRGRGDCSYTTVRTRVDCAAQPAGHRIPVLRRFAPGRAKASRTKIHDRQRLVSTSVQT